MPVFCAALGCNNRRSVDSKSRGVTFHKFPSELKLRRVWEVSVRRVPFVATNSSKLCSEHFKPEDFDRTGQTVRLREGVTPSVFNFPSRGRKAASGKKTKPSRKAEESPPVDVSQNLPQTRPEPNDAVLRRQTDTSRKAEESPPMAISQNESETRPQPNDDHSYSLPCSPNDLKARLQEALARVESLEREKINAVARERRAKKMVKSLQEDLKKKRS
ncbi:THAP domain-containing protein 6 [Oryzias melastigma]|uniref:THAP domain-containing protein 6 n=1 Tax=Oryzias melastigma TaxID=30732 RepID=UPI000CF83496|nr:THAP domain-containing protein 6 [Oryzias melastigma]